MRTIKFRGQTIDNKWVYGDLIQIGGGALIYHGDKQTVDEIPQEDSPCAVGFYPNEISPVKPNTVCQFTGLFDKNGVEIYEGDILSGKEFWNIGMIDLTYEERDLFELNDLKGELHNKYITDVAYEPGCFVIKTGKEDYDCTVSVLEGNQKHSQPIFDFEVIGNIYENPELLQ